MSPILSQQMIVVAPKKRKKKRKKNLLAGCHVPVVGSIIDYELVIESKDPQNAILPYKNPQNKHHRKNGGRLFHGDLIDFKGESRTGGRKLSKIQELNIQIFYFHNSA